MSNVIFGILLIAVGGYLIVYRERFLKSVIDYQNSIFNTKINTNKSANKIVLCLYVSFGVLFILIGILRIFGITGFKN